jgi:hypothetical protein
LIHLKVGLLNFVGNARSAAGIARLFHARRLPWISPLGRRGEFAQLIWAELMDRLLVRPNRVGAAQSRSVHGEQISEVNGPSINRYIRVKPIRSAVCCSAAQ